MQTFALTTFLADAEDRARARASGVSAIPVDALRNKGGNRTAKKRALLANAVARGCDRQRAIVSYF